jgi:hypothetical protein
MSKQLFTLALTGACLALVGCGGHGSNNRPVQAVNPGARAQAAAPAQPAPATAQVQGRLTDHESGLGLAQATVFAQQGTEPVVIATATTDAEGRYTLAGLPLGQPLRVVSQPVTGALSYGLEASAAITLVQGTTQAPVELAFTKVALAGRVEAAAPIRHRGRRIEALTLVHVKDLGAGQAEALVARVIEPDATGAFQLEAVPPGTYQLRYRRAGGHGHPRGLRRPHSGPLHPGHGHPRHHRGEQGPWWTPGPRQGDCPEAPMVKGPITVKAGETCHPPQ